MTLPRFLLGTVLLLSVQLLPALEISVDAETEDGYALASGRAVGFDRSDILDRLDAGGTVRLIWQFRLGETETLVVRYARRDALGEGYVVYGYEEDITGPYMGEVALEVLMMLPPTRLVELGSWESDEKLEGRLFMDYGKGLPSMSLLSVLLRDRRSTPWTAIPHPEAGG